MTQANGIDESGIDLIATRGVRLNGSALDPGECVGPETTAFLSGHITVTDTSVDKVMPAVPSPSRAEPVKFPPDRRSLGMEAPPALPRTKQVHYDGDALDLLADLLADRLAARLSLVTASRPEPLVDAAEIARLNGKTRSWVYEHAGELGAVRLGSGPRPRLGFSPARVAQQLHKVEEPASVSLPDPVPPRRRQRAGRTATGAPMLHVRSLET
jgi:hypothetical protein